MDQNSIKNKKFIISLLVGFLAVLIGAFLAFYALFYNLSQDFGIVEFKDFNKSVFMASPEKVFNNFDKDFSRRIEELNKNNQYFSNIREFKSSDVFNNDFSTVNIQEDRDKYILKLNLKPFGNNENNIKVETKDNRVIIKANYNDKKNNNFNSSNFYQSLSLSKNVKPEEIQKVVKNGILTVTIPKKGA